MPPYFASEGLAGVAASLVSFLTSPYRHYFCGYRPRANGRPVVADPGAKVQAPGGAKRGERRGGGAGKRRGSRPPIGDVLKPPFGATMEDRGNPGAHPPPWLPGSCRSQRPWRTGALHWRKRNSARARAELPAKYRFDESPTAHETTHGAEHRGNVRNTGKWESTRLFYSRENDFSANKQANWTVRDMDQLRGAVDKHQSRKRKHAPDRYGISREPLAAGPNSFYHHNKRQRFAEEALNRSKSGPQRLSPSARRRKRRSAKNGQDPLSAIYKVAGQSTWDVKPWKYDESCSNLAGKHRAAGTYIVPNENAAPHRQFVVRPAPLPYKVFEVTNNAFEVRRVYWNDESKPVTSAMNRVISAGKEWVLKDVADVPVPPSPDPRMAVISAADEWTRVEAADVALRASQRQKPGNVDHPAVTEEERANDEGKLPGISAVDKYMLVETADVALPASQRRGTGHPDLPAVTEEKRAKDEGKLPGIPAVDECMVVKVGNVSQEQEPGELDLRAATEEVREKDEDRPPGISSIHECMHLEAADVALPAAPGQETGEDAKKKDKGKLPGISAVDEYPLVEAVDVAVRTLQRLGMGELSLPTVAQGIRAKDKGKLPGDSAVDKCAFAEAADVALPAPRGKGTGDLDLPSVTEEARAKVEGKLPGILKELLDGRGTIPAHAGMNLHGCAVKLNSHDFSTLRNGEWLNDEIINEYLSLIAKRGKDAGFPKVHVFNTFFYRLLVDHGYDKVKRWTKKINIFELDYVLVPIHLGMHWVLACMDMKQKKITYYDSFHNPNQAALKALLNYVRAEAKTKNVDANGWTAELAKGNPTQRNGSDCGVFACMAADCLSRNVQLAFSQDQMPNLRRRMAGALFYGKV